MESQRKPFKRSVSRLFWDACNLNDRDNFDLGRAMFYLGYTELSVRRACIMLKDDPERNKYIAIAKSMGLDESIDSLEVF